MAAQKVLPDGVFEVVEAVIHEHGLFVGVDHALHGQNVVLALHSIWLLVERLVRRNQVAVRDVAEGVVLFVRFVHG